MLATMAPTLIPTFAPTLIPSEATGQQVVKLENNEVEEPELHSVDRHQQHRYHRHHHRHRRLQGNQDVNSTFYILPSVDQLMHVKETRKYHGDECHLVHDLPVGKHVFTIMTNKQYDKMYSLSHVIQW